MRQDSLPPVFAQYEGLVHCVHRHSEKRWTSSCPACGGEEHSEPGRRGELSDRCVWFVDDKPLGWCSRCSSLFWADQAPGYKPPTPEELAAWIARHDQELEARRKHAERILADFRRSEIWQRYHDQMTDVMQRWWEQRGVPRCFQDYWKLGWKDGHHIMGPGGVWTAVNAATIPVFDSNWDVLNIKLRLADDRPQGVGKYIYELSHQGRALYRCEPDRALDGIVVAIEGEIKAMVAFLTMDGAMNVVGLPGATPGRSSETDPVIASLSGAERVVLVLDPDSRGQEAAWAERVGKGRLWVLNTHAKIDDAILAGGLDGSQVRAWLRQARRMDARRESEIRCRQATRRTS